MISVVQMWNQKNRVRMGTNSQLAVISNSLHSYHENVCFGTNGQTEGMTDGQSLNNLS